AAHSFAKPQNPSQSENLPPQQDRFIAVGAVRTINTAEVAYFYTPNNDAQRRNRYATWSELYSSGVFDEMKRSAPEVHSLFTADGIQGYNLALIVSPDGQYYELALHDAKPESGRFSVFTDQSGLIYTGSPLR